MPGITVLSIAVSSNCSSQLRLPLTPSVIVPFAVEMRNVLFPVTGANVNGPSGNNAGVGSTNTNADNPLYLHRTVGTDAVHVKVTSVPLQTSVPASLDSSTAAETERNSTAHDVHLLHVYLSIYTISRIVSVCLSVTDVTSLPQRALWERGYNVYHHAYAGNESPNCRHWWSALITRHSHNFTGGLRRRDRRH